MAQAEEIVFVSRFDDSQLDAAFKRFTASIDKAQGAVDNLSGEIDKAMKDAVKETDAFNKELAKTEKAAEAPAKAITQTNTAIDGFIKRNESLAASIAELEKAKKRDGSITDANSRKLENARKEIEENNAAIKRMSGATADSTKATAQNTAATTEQGAASATTGKRLVSFSSILRDIVRSNGDVVGALRRAREEMDLNGQSAGSLFKGMFSLRSITTGLAGAFVALVGVSLAAYFRTNEAAASRLKETFSAFGEQAKVVTGRLGEFAGSLIRIVQGDAVKGEGVKNLIRIFSDYGDELQRAKELGEDLARTQKFLDVIAAQTIPVIGKRIGEEERYRDVVANTNASINSRLGALTKPGR